MSRQEDMAVASRIRLARIESGLTLKEFGALIGVTFQQAHKYETGVNRVSAGTLLVLARSLGRPIRDFFPAEDETPSPIAIAHPQAAQELVQLLRQEIPQERVQALLVVARALLGVP